MLHNKFFKIRPVSKKRIRIIATLYFLLLTYYLFILIPIFIEWIFLAPFDSFLLILNLVGLPMMVGYFISGYGLWDFKKWGLYFALGTSTAFIIFYSTATIYLGIIYDIAFEDFFGFSIIPVIFQGIAIFLLWNSKNRFK